MNALHYFLDIVFEDAEAVKLLDKQILKVNPLLWNEVHLCGVSADSRTLKFFMEKFFPDGDEKLILLDRCAAALDVEFFRTALDKLNNRYPELLNIEPPKTSVDENRIIERRCRRSSATRKQEELIEEELIVTEMRKPSDYAKFRTSLYDDLEEPEGLHLRAYQEELVEPALRGKNTIACAPTGSGKTEVAIYVAVSHLNEKESKKEPARILKLRLVHLYVKVAMLVPRTPLVDQQKYRFHKYVRGR
ncbi:unnamed protein product [Nippostrongylus brasiliensis]|uniref:Helicase ATP-binding domain-containing protein n=1 Tax=Nippostrongylus brasiliensis TaxID=27835 RepID=A0A0N4XH29_NIPBR|nr:unnamed protein product [Nippostrongylus brasiliensis]